MRLRTTLLTGLAALLAVAACGNDDLPDAAIDNVVGVDTLGALRFTSVATRSGFNVAAGTAVPTHTGARFEFLYDLDSAGAPVFIPAQAAGVLAPSSSNPGLQKVDVPFDSLTEAKSNGYIYDAPLAVDSGDVFLMRSYITCGIGVPYYGKLEVQQIDTVAHTIVVRFIVDQNCGYRGLEPGLPEH
jgi:hypothetical protein